MISHLIVFPPHLKPTDAEKYDFKGAVMQVVETLYKAHTKNNEVFQDEILLDRGYNEGNQVLWFDEMGMKTKSQSFGAHTNEVRNFSGNAMEDEKLEYDLNGVFKSKTVYTFFEKVKLKSSRATNADGSQISRTIHEYNDAGNPVSFFHYYGVDEKVISKTLHFYNQQGSTVRSESYEDDVKLKTVHTYEYNEQNNRTVSKTVYMEKSMQKMNSHHTNTYNDKGDVIELTFYNVDGTIKSQSFFSPEYDKDGKLIKKELSSEIYRSPLPNGHTEVDELDEFGNWTKKTLFFNNRALNIRTRQFRYHHHASAALPELVHMLDTIEGKNPNAKIIKAVKEPPRNLPDFDAEELRWLGDLPTASADNFSAFRYYIIRFKEVPSLLALNGPFIEAVTFVEELKKKYNPQIIHSSLSVWDGYRNGFSKLTLLFPYNSYIITCSSVSNQNADGFDVPDGFDFDGDTVSIGNFQLLCPCEASPERDYYFEEELIELVENCSLQKKPDKPFINVVETGAGGFKMVEHAVDDNFEIKDLDVNYGFGFQKFHTDLMGRFSKSTKGLVLFHGLPGTGKTYYIRHLLRAMARNNKVVIYMPPNMVDHLVDPGFMTFLSAEIKDWSSEGKFCVLLIEDAEPLLAKRQEGIRIQGVTNLLNMTDGLLNDMLNLQIICTFNVDLKKLDSALLRPGRLIARKEFKALSQLDANLLASRLGIKHHFTKPATLGQIYALGLNKNTLIHDVEPERDASKEIDDL